MTTTYQVIDNQTKYVISTHATRAAASRKAERLDRAYGAIMYFVKPIFAAQ